MITPDTDVHWPLLTPYSRRLPLPAHQAEGLTCNPPPTPSPADASSPASGVRTHQCPPELPWATGGAPPASAAAARVSSCSSRGACVPSAKRSRSTRQGRPRESVHTPAEVYPATSVSWQWPGGLPPPLLPSSA